MVLRGVRHESEVLVRQVDGRLVTLRSRGDRSPVGFEAADIEQAELVAGRLRQLVDQTALSSAADRARVRAAVHYFIGLRNSRSAHRRQRSLAEDLRVVDHMVRELSEVTWG